jgi:NUMOD3 motif
MKFYVYEHWRPDRDICFYVGKGQGTRSHDKKNRNRHHKGIQNKLAKLGMCIEVRMVASGLSEDSAFALEIERIDFWRKLGIKLANKTEGGEGRSGSIASRITRQKNSHHSRLLWQKPGHRELMIRKLTGQTRSEKQLKTYSAAQKKRVESDDDLLSKLIERCRRLAADRVGKPGRPISDAEKLAAALRRLGTKHSAETLEKMSAAKLGKPRKPFTEETLAKMRNAAALRESAKRAKFGTEVRRTSKLKEPA